LRVPKEKKGHQWQWGWADSDLQTRKKREDETGNKSMDWKQALTEKFHGFGHARKELEETRKGEKNYGTDRCK